MGQGLSQAVGNLQKSFMGGRFGPFGGLNLVDQSRDKVCCRVFRCHQSGWCRYRLGWIQHDDSVVFPRPGN